MDIEKHVRSLAKSYKYQTISNGGDNPTNCFINKSDYTFFQIFFWSYLKFYNTLFTDISEEEVDEFVLTDTIYEDAYMYWRGKNKMKQIKESIDKKFHNPTDNKKPTKEQEVSSFRWNLKSKK